MIRPDLINIQNADAFSFAQSLAKRIKDSSISPENLSSGDFAIITLKNEDKIGKISKVVTLSSDKRAYNVFLDTVEGSEIVPITYEDTIHVIGKKVSMGLDLRKHDSYERDLHNVKDKGVPTTGGDEFNKFPPTAKYETDIGNDKVSQLPAAKKLSLRNPSNITKLSLRKNSNAS